MEERIIAIEEKVDRLCQLADRLERILNCHQAMARAEREYDRTEEDEE